MEGSDRQKAKLGNENIVLSYIRKKKKKIYFLYIQKATFLAEEFIIFTVLSHEIRVS